MGDNPRIFSVLSLLFGVVAIFFVGVIAGILAIVFASIAYEKYDDESEETRAGLVLGVVNLCIMGLIILGTILSALQSGIVDPLIFSWLFGFGPCGFCSMATGGIPIPIVPFMYY